MKPIIYLDKIVDTPPETPTPSSPGERVVDLDPDLQDFCQRYNINPAVEDLSDEEISIQEDLPHEPESEGPEISTQTDLDRFSSALRDAQRLAIEKERGTRKRKTPKTYTGNSAKTLQRHKKKREKMKSDGYLGVFEYIELKRARSTVELGDPQDQDAASPREIADQQAGPNATADQRVNPNAIADQQADPDTADLQAIPGAPADQQANLNAIVDQQTDPEHPIVAQQADPDILDRDLSAPVPHFCDAMRQEEESDGSVESEVQIDLEDEESDNVESEDRSMHALKSKLEILKQQ